MFKKNKAVKHNLYWLPLLILFITSLFFSTKQKIPFFERELWSLKDSSVTEVAINIIRENNIFLRQLRYQAHRVDMFENPNGLRSLNNIPDPLLLSTVVCFKLFPSNSYELNTRLVMFLWFWLLVLSVYLYFSIQFDKCFALIISILVASSSHLAFWNYYIPQSDGPAMALFFISIIFLGKFINTGKFWYIPVCAFFTSIAFLQKSNMYLILLPFIFLQLILTSEKKLVGLINFFTVFFLSYFMNRYMIRSAYEAFFRLNYTNLIVNLLILCLIIFLSYILHKFKFKISKELKNRLSLKIYLIIFLSLIILYIGRFASRITTNYFLEHFITDRFLILNFPLYLNLLKRIGLYTNNYIATFAVVGFILSLVKGSKKTRIISLCFIVSSLVWMVIGSKSIFFHDYYFIFFILTVYLGFTFLIYHISNIHKQNLIIFIFTIILLSFFSLSEIHKIPKVKGRHLRRNNIREVSEFLNEISDPNDKFVANQRIQVVLPIYTHLVRANFGQLRIISEELINQDLYNILAENKFRIVIADRNNLADYISSFNSILHPLETERVTDLRAINFSSIPFIGADYIVNNFSKMSNRSREIYRRLGLINYERITEKNPNFSQERFFSLNDFLEIYTFEKQIGRYYIYRLKD